MRAGRLKNGRCGFLSHLNCCLVWTFLIDSTPMYFAQKLGRDGRGTIEYNSHVRLQYRLSVTKTEPGTIDSPFPIIDLSPF